MVGIKDGDIYTLRLGKGSRTTFKVEVVISDSAIKQGLSGRERLEPGAGMLFIFNELGRQAMWMIEMKFPLDIVWLDENLQVVHITYGANPCKSRAECPSYTSRYRVKYAIEMVAGVAEEYGFSIGLNLVVV